MDPRHPGHYYPGNYLRRQSTFESAVILSSDVQSGYRKSGNGPGPSSLKILADGPKVSM